MERFIENLIRDFESGRINRRQFCETFALAASVYASGASAANAPARGFRMLGVNHIAYDCPDYRPARDFYTSVFGLENIKEDGMTRANLAFGPPQGAGGGFLVVRNTPANAPPRARSTVDHVCFTVQNWDETKVRAALAARNLEPNGRPGSWHVFDPYDFDLQFGNSVEENGFRRGV
jgi:catechol 2,3-dioxygenase-like lactoylglutathione lyase family enzyme